MASVEAEHDVKIDVDEETAPPPSRIRNLGKALLKQWFMFGIVFAVLLAYAIPFVGKKGGPLAPQITMKIAVGIVFFLSGLSLKYRALVQAFVYLRLHIFIQSYSFVLMPAVMYLLMLLIRFILPSFNHLANGVLVLASLPTTVTTNVVYTKAADGNEAAALFNSTFGNIFGIFLSPALVLLLIVGSNSAGMSIPFESVLTQLAYMVVAPVVAGQLVRAIFRKYIEGKKLKTSIISNFVVLFIIFTVFCETFSSSATFGSVPAVLMIVLIAILVICYAGFVVLSWYLSKLSFFKFSPADRVAIVLTSSQKTLSLGIPMISIIFEGNPVIGLITMPLLIYHPISLLTASLLVPRLKSWIAKQPLDRNEIEMSP